MMHTSTKLVVGNWKANPVTERSARVLAHATDFPDAVIAPPFPFLETVLKTVRRAKVCAQDAFWAETGPYTGEVTPIQLKTMGVRYVILGHSERRRFLDETDAMINKKMREVLRADLIPILCVGEHAAVRARGVGAAEEFVKKQLSAALKGIPASRFGDCVIAYEPVWAISTEHGSRADTPENADRMHAFLRVLLKKMGSSKRVPILYGGSVKAKNAAAFLAQRNVDGVLVGGASLKSGEFKKIVQFASQ